MLTLYILRHAEAAAEHKDDLARKLTARGKAQANAVGLALKDGAGPKPALVLHSPAVRVRETVAGLRKLMPTTAAREVQDVYNGSADELYNVIRLHGGKSTPLMLVGHNPGIAALAGMLCSTGEPDVFQRMLSGFMPATLAMIECPIEQWSDLMPDVNRIVAFDYPAA
jgi:phosphohistidine phosphatase